MEWAVLSLNNPTHFIINRITGAAQNIPTVSDMLSNIRTQLQTPHTITPERKEVLKSALLAMLEATEIALTVVAIKLAYNNPEIEFAKDNLITGLNAQKTNIVEIQKQVNAVNNQPSSYYSWMFGSNTPSKPAKLTYINQKSVPFDNNAPSIAIPADLMPSIIQLHDYKQLSDATLAANLLFKQCYIAQQQHQDNPIAINQQNPLNANNFLYTHFPNIYINGSYPICQDALKLGIDARLPLQQIRQAIQTALSIANKKFAGNLSSYIPQYFTSFLDGVLTQLMRYDEYVGNLCKIPMYGATREDLAKAAEWSNLSKAAATVGTVAVLAIAYHAVGETGRDIALKAIGKNVGWLGKTASDNASSLGQAVYGAATSDTTQKVLYNVGEKVATGAAVAATGIAVGMAKDTITDTIATQNANPMLIQSTNKLVAKLADNFVSGLEKKIQ